MASEHTIRRKHISPMVVSGTSTEVTLLHVHKHTRTHKFERADVSPHAAHPPVLSVCGPCGRGVKVKVRGLKPSMKSVAALSLQIKRGSQLSSTFYLSIFSLVVLFQANWFNLETTDDENDLHEEQNHTARPLQVCTFNNWFEPEPKI